VITLNRPDVLNAFDTEPFELMAERMVEAQEDAATRVVVLTGAGRAFSAGADLSGRPPARESDRYGFCGLVDVVIDFPKPFIVAVNGVGVRASCSARSGGRPSGAGPTGASSTSSRTRASSTA